MLLQAVLTIKYHNRKQDLAPKSVRTIVPYCVDGFCLERHRFPGPTADLPEIFATCFPNLCEEYLIIHTGLRGVTDEDGVPFSCFGFHERCNGQKMLYKDHSIEVNFLQVPETRRAGSVHASSNRGNFSVLDRCIVRVPGLTPPRMLPISPSFPQYSNVMGYQLAKGYRAFALWLPGPSTNNGYLDLEGGIRRYAAVNRVATAETMEAVSIPYGPMEDFRRAVALLPQNIHVLALVVHSNYHVNYLQDCINVVAGSERLTSLRVNYCSPQVWTPGLCMAGGNLTALTFHGIENVGTAGGVIQILVRNPLIHFVRLQGKCVPLTAVLNWIVHRGQHMDTLAIEVTGNGSTNTVLNNISQLKWGLEFLSLKFNSIPDFKYLRKAVFRHKKSLRTLYIALPDMKSIHGCGDKCRDYGFLPRHMPELKELKLETLPCSAVALKEVSLLSQNLCLEFRPSAMDTLGSLAIWLHPVLKIPSPVFNLTLDRIACFGSFAYTKTFWANVTHLTLRDLHVFDIRLALEFVGDNVRHLTLIIAMGSAHTAKSLDPDVIDAYPNGLTDEFFLGCPEDEWTTDESDDSDAEDAAAHSGTPRGLAKLKNLHSLSITVTRTTNDDWARPAVWTSFLVGGLKRQRQLKWFSCNEVSEDVKAYLVRRKERKNGFTFDVEISGYQHQ